MRGGLRQNSAMAVSPTLASVLLLIADSAIAHPDYWVTRTLEGYGGCGTLITELTPAQLQNGGMFNNGFTHVEPSADATLAADGESYVIPVPEAAWMVTAKVGVLGPLPGEPDRSTEACPNLFQSERGGPASAPAVLWTPPAGASGDYTIDVGFAPGVGLISYYSYRINIAAAESPSPTLPPQSPAQPPPTPASPLPSPPPPSPLPPTVPPMSILSPPLLLPSTPVLSPVLSPPTPVLSPQTPVVSPPLPISSPPSPVSTPFALTLCTGADADCPDGFTCNCYAVGSQRRILFASTPETCVCEAR